MKKYLLRVWEYEDQSITVVETENINEAFVEFCDYYGIPYPLQKNDLINLFKDFTVERFIEYFEQAYSYTIYGIYEVKETLFEKGSIYEL